MRFPDGRLRLLIALFCALAGPGRGLETLTARPGTTEEPAWVSHGCEAIRDFIQTTTFRNLDPWIGRRKQWTKDEIYQIISNLGQPNWTLIPNYTPQWNGNTEFAQQVVFSHVEYFPTQPPGQARRVLGAETA